MRRIYIYLTSRSKESRGIPNVAFIMKEGFSYIHTYIHIYTHLQIQGVTWDIKRRVHNEGGVLLEEGLELQRHCCTWAATDAIYLDVCVSDL